MKSIKDDIKTKEFAPVYLIYGTESYLKSFYRNKLKEAVLGGGDLMNVSSFNGNQVSEQSIIDEAETLPFFSDKRVVVVENSGLFKKQNELADYIKKIPETTVLIFVESEVDKRNRLFKAVSETGIVEEMNSMEEGDLLKWIGTLFMKSGKNITTRTAQVFLDRVGADMYSLTNEIEKLVCYVGDRDVVTETDVYAVSSEHIEGKIFQMMDAISSKKQEEALRLYYDLLALRQAPASILALTIRQFNILYQIKELSKSRVDNKTMASLLGVPPFAVNKYLGQSRNFESRTLLEAVEYGTGLEADFKRGLIEDRLACELLIVKYSI